MEEEIPGQDHVYPQMPACGRHRLVPLPGEGSVTTVGMDNRRLERSGEGGDDVRRIPLSDVQSSTGALEGPLQILQGFEHEAQGRRTVVRMVLDLAGVEDEDRGDLLTLPQGAVETRVVLEPQIASEEEDSALSHDPDRTPATTR